MIRVSASEISKLYSFVYVYTKLYSLEILERQRPTDRRDTRNANIMLIHVTRSQDYLKAHLAIPSSLQLRCDRMIVLQYNINSLHVRIINDGKGGDDR